MHIIHAVAETTSEAYLKDWPLCFSSALLTGDRAAQCHLQLKRPEPGQHIRLRNRTHYYVSSGLHDPRRQCDHMCGQWSLVGACANLRRYVTTNYHDVMTWKRFPHYWPLLTVACHRFCYHFRVFIAPPLHKEGAGRWKHENENKSVKRLSLNELLNKQVFGDLRRHYSYMTSL